MNPVANTTLSEAKKRGKLVMQDSSYPLPKNLPTLIMMGLMCRALTRAETTDMEAPRSETTNMTNNDTICNVKL